MISDYYDFFIFLGGLLLLGGIIYLLFSRYFKDIFISEEEISKLIVNNASTKRALPKVSLSFVLLVIIIGAFLLNQILILKMGGSGLLTKPFSININVARR